MVRSTRASGVVGKALVLVGGGFFLIWSGDESTRQIVHVQPMKFAAIEGLYHGQTGAPLVAIGIMSESEDDPDNENIKEICSCKI